MVKDKSYEHFIHKKTALWQKMDIEYKVYDIIKETSEKG